MESRTDAFGNSNHFKLRQKHDDPEMEAALLADSSQELLIGKWYYNVTSNGDASACEAQSYYNFTDTKKLEYQLVIDDFGLVVSGYELIGDCHASGLEPP